MQPTERSRWTPGNGLAWAVYAAGMAVLAALVFGDLGDRAVANYDDFHYLLQSERISGDFLALLSPEYHGPRPVTDLVFWLAFELWGKEPKGYYALTICIHSLASIFLAILCQRIGSSRDTAFVAGAFFLTTVAHFRNLFVISGLAYPLALSFTFVAAHWFTIARQPGQSRWYGALSGAGLLAALSHPAAIAVFPFCIFVGFNRRDRISAIVPRVIASGIGAAAAILSMVYFYPHKIQSYHSAHIPDIARISEHLLWLLGRLLATAHWLAAPVYGYQSWELGLGLVGLAAIAFLLFQRGAAAAEWSFWVLIMMLPFVNRLPTSFMLGDSGPSHYLYFASAGFAVLSAMLLREVAMFTCRRGGPRIGRLLLFALSAGIVAYSAAAIDELEAFSFHRSGEFYLRQRDEDNAVRQLSLAVDRLESDKVIDGERAYVALCYALLLKGGRIAPTMNEARQKYPDSYRLAALSGAVNSMNPDSTVRRRGSELIRQAQESADGRNQGEQFNAQMAETYECLADALNGERDFRRATEAARRSLAYGESARTYFALGNRAYTAG